MDQCSRSYLVTEVRDFTGFNAQIPVTLATVVYRARQDVITPAFWRAIPPQHWRLLGTTSHFRLAKLEPSLKVSEVVVDALAVTLEAKPAGIKHLIHMGCFWPSLQAALGGAVVATSGSALELPGMLMTERAAPHDALALKSLLAYDMVSRDRAVPAGTWLLFSL